MVLREVYGHFCANQRPHYVAICSGNAGTGISANTLDRVYPVISTEILVLVKGRILMVKMESTANCTPI